MWGAGPGGHPGGNPWSHPHQQQTPQGLGQGPNLGSQPPSGWSMNPTHYANIPHNQVDWAALAQQWMVLKGTGGAGNMDNTINPQNNIGGMPMPMSMHPGMRSGGRGGMIHPNQNSIMFANNSPITPVTMQVNHATPFHHLGRVNNSGSLGSLGSQQDDGPPGEHSQQGRRPGGGDCVTPLGDIIGEAPMELEDEPHKPVTNEGWKSTQQSNWYAPEVNNPWSTALSNAAAAAAGVNDGNGHSNIQYEAMTAASSAPGGQLRPTKRKKNRQAPATAEYGYYNTHQQTRAPSGNAAGYWSSNDDGSKDNSSVSAAALTEELKLSMSMLESHMPHYSYSTAMTMTGGEYSSDDNSMPEMDAARRKTLPAWIREGLEKMERQKQRKEEEERLAAEKEEIRKRLMEEQAAKAAEDPEVAVSNSKWNQSESQPPSEDESGDEEREKELQSDVLNMKTVEVPSLASILKNLPQDEQDDAIMYAIRRVSTTLLVKLTNEIIHDAASTSYNRAKSRKKVTSTMQVKKTSALASIAGGFGLGLGGYGSESEESNASKSDEEDNTGSEDNKDRDTDEELMNEIDKKKRNWEMLKLELENKTPHERSSSARNNEESASGSRVMDPHNGGSSSKNVKREVDNAIVANTFEGSRADDVTTTRSNGVKLLTTKGDEIDGNRTKKAEKEKNSTRDRDRKDRSNSKSPLSKRSNRKHRSTSSNSRKRSRSNSRSRKSDRKRRARSRSRSRSRSSSPSRRGRGRHHSRSRSASKSKSKRSRSRSKDRRRRNKSRSKSKDRRRSRSPTRRDRRRSKSRSNSRDTLHSRNRSNERSRRKKSRSKSLDRNRRSKSSESTRTKDRKRARSTEKSEKNKKTSSKRSSRKSRSRSQSPSTSSLEYGPKPLSKHGGQKQEQEQSSSKLEDSEGFTKPKKKHDKPISRSRSRSNSRSSSANSKTSDRSKKPREKNHSTRKDKDSKKSYKKDKKSKHRSSSSSS